MFDPNFLWGDYEDEPARVAYYMQLFAQARVRRVNFEPQWEKAALMCWPEYANTFSYGHVISPGLERTQFQIDSRAAIASHRFMAIVNYILTPTDLVWSKICPAFYEGLQATDRDLMKDKPTRLWFERTTKKLWHARYDWRAGFIGNNQQNLQSLGVFGNHGMYIEKREDNIFGKGLSYVATPPGQIYLLTSRQGMIIGYIRHFRIDAQQAYVRWKDKIPPVLQAALAIQSKTLYNFFEIVHPNNYWLPWQNLTPRGKKFSSCYISVEGYNIIEEGGYRSFPLPFGRYMVAPEEDYGRGPAQMVLPALKTLNAIKKDFLKQAHMAGDPAYLIGDDGLVDFKASSGAINAGGVGPAGEQLVHVVPAGDIKISEEAMNVESKVVEDGFLVTLFSDLLDDAKKEVQLSARQVVERAVSKGIFMSPLGRQFTEYLGPMINRELDLLSSLGMLDPQTPAMKEAKGAYNIEYCSWMGRSAKVQEAAATMQFLEQMGQLSNQTKDPSFMDSVEADEASAVIAAGGGVPERVLSSPESRQRKAKARADAEAREQQTKEMPARAAIIKAQAIAAKAQAGQNIGGTLSGTPEGGMPSVPGNPPGTPGQPSPGPGQPGIPGQPGA